ncbi:Aste57867_8398 [Aphanomyces stellatus]|uniref:Aste57867_8398 protein n=1 Tax=Aphanomyces stellatus TaxID=120398 RepID=A0A485KK45_9STRA|nr:hypothetical protein As57867_008366 [Aphanomyces stellatus]VFT85284.1 Aste57867_8398 [Aphanomyces stellatus]
MLKNELGRKWRDIPWDDVLQQRATADKYFMRSGLIRKDLLPQYALEHTPPTFVVSSIDDLDTALNQINDDDKSSDVDSMWVLKLCDSSNAFGIHIFHGRNKRSIYSILDDMERRVLQKYVSPMLYGDKKFHLRVLVLAVGHLDVYVFEDCRMLVASAPFSTDCLDSLVHITNQSTNRAGNPRYEERSQNVLLRDAAAFPPDFEVATMSQVHNICRDTFRRVARNRRHFFSLPNCYELFGLDFMVDVTGRVWLLEVNPDPSLGMFHGRGVVPATVLEAGGVPSSFTRVYSLGREEAFAKLKRDGC